MLFYGFGSSFDERWTFAATIHPESQMVQWRCRDCGATDRYPAGAFDVAVEGGTEYPDLLGCGAYPLLLVTERAVALFKSRGILCFQQYPVRVVAVRNSPLRIEDAPSYFRLEITGECMIDLVASGVVVRGVCCRCGSLQRDAMALNSFGMVAGSWDGSDLFRDPRYFPRRVFATQRVVDIVSEAGLTNWEFVSTATV